MGAHACLSASAQSEEIVQLVHERAQHGEAPQDIAQHLVRIAFPPAVLAPFTHQV